MSTNTNPTTMQTFVLFQTEAAFIDVLTGRRHPSVLPQRDGYDLAAGFKHDHWAPEMREDIFTLYNGEMDRDEFKDKYTVEDGEYATHKRSSRSMSKGDFIMLLLPGQPHSFWVVNICLSYGWKTIVEKNPATVHTLSTEED